MKSKKIKDKDGEERVIAKDGRKMHPNSMPQNIPAMKKHIGRLKPGETANPNGRPQAADKLFREELRELLQQPYWKSKDKNERKQLVKELLEKAIEKYMTTKNDNTFLRLLDLFVSSTDGKIIESQGNNNAIIAQNVIYLPQKREEPIQAQVIEEKPLEVPTEPPGD